MSNTLTGLIPTLYEALDVVSREFVGFIPAVQRDNGNFARAAKGQVVDVPISPPVVASDITPGVTAPNDGDQTIASKQMTINKSRYVPIRWNGEEQRGINNNGPGVSNILLGQMAQAFRTLTNEVETDIAVAAYTNGSRATGTAGVTPFGTAGDLSDFAGTAQILDDNGAPMGMRRLVMGSPAMANIRGKQSVLFKVNEAGTDDLLRRGTIGEVQGMMLGYSAQSKVAVPVGTGANFVTTAALPVGTTAIPLGTGTGTVSPGDIISIAGDPNKYVVNDPTRSGGTGGSISGPGTVYIGYPGLRVAAPSGAAVTLQSSFTPNVAFTSDAMVLAARLPAVPEFNGIAADMADDRQTLVDEYSGLAFEVSLYRQYRQIKLEVGLAWGVGVIESSHIAVLEG